jgi:two-component system chemotaxis response regulator CheB
MVFRVLVADDSALIRRLLVTSLELEPDMRVVGQAKDGGETLRLCVTLRPDVVIMDLNMPVMDGLQATQRILEQMDVPIIVLSGYVHDTATLIAFEAFRAGAVAVIAKPAGPDEAELQRMHTDLVRTVRSVAGTRVIPRSLPTTGTLIPPLPAQSTPSHVRSVAIVASTGGPAALHFLLRRLPGAFPAPVLIVQHISRGFVSGLVDWLNSDCALDVRLAQAGELPMPGQVLFAPDDGHMTLDRDGFIALQEGDPVDGQRPSGTLLLQSVARVHGAQAIGIVLTGTGTDGAQGLLQLRQAGGQTLAQDEASSVVYDLPREAAQIGAVQAVLPLERIVAHLLAVAA